MKYIGIKKCILVLIGLIFLTDLFTLLNIPFLRQIFGFFFLTFLPGLIILQILKINKIQSTEKFILSVGLSIAFLMFFGLLLNNSSLGLGYTTPLLTVPLLISFNLTVFTLIFIAYQMNKYAFFSLSVEVMIILLSIFVMAPVITDLAETSLPSFEAV